MAKQKVQKTKVFGKYTRVNKRGDNLKVNEITAPRTSGRYRGTSIARDRNGFFVTTHRARSKSYSSLASIPDSKIAFVRSTG